MKKINYKPILRKAAYYGVTVLIFIGIIGGIKAHFIQQNTIETVDADSYTLKYIKTLFNKPTDELAITERKEYLIKNYYNTEFHDIFVSDVAIAVTTNVEKKQVQLISESALYVQKEYVYIIDYAYRYTDDTETHQQQEAIKIIVLYDKKDKSYLIQDYTAFDYEYNVGISSEARKTFDETLKQKSQLSGDGLTEVEKESYKKQLVLFFDTYSVDLNAAKSLISENVELPVLSGTFDIETLKITNTAKTNQNIKLIVQIEYSSIDQSLKYKKEFIITIVDKTIVELEEI